MNASPPTINQLRETFPDLFHAHRRELYVHCYRMTGSIGDAEDLTQEVFLRAWRSLDRYEARATPRTWLYRIATNACLDFLKHHDRRTAPSETVIDTLEHAAWIEPYPDRLDPADVIVRRESTDLYLATALMHLPVRQRAAVIACDLVELDAAQTAELLQCSVAAVNSLVQRAHERLRGLGVAPEQYDLSPSVNRDLVSAYIDAHERGDVDKIIDLLDADVRISMPPESACRGASGARSFFAQILGPDGPGSWKLEQIWAGGGPAVANYVRAPGASSFRGISIDVLRIEGDRIVALHCFLGGAQFAAFGLPDEVRS